jgi:hypothetical protein
MSSHKAAVSNCKEVYQGWTTKWEKNNENVKWWVITYTNKVEYEIDDANMCFMGYKSMGNECIIMSKALS